MNESLLKAEERAVYSLRMLYSRYGYMPYKMSKFEEYDLYVKHKDFLISDGIITFTDTRGKLLALKPDVTLSIVKNSKDVGNNVYKLYYNENVYRIANTSHAFKEITQTGLECIGNINEYHTSEVVSLAVRSLAVLSDDYLLDISHVGLLRALLAPFALPEEANRCLLEAISAKNSAALSRLAEDGVIPETCLPLSVAFMQEYRDVTSMRLAFSPYLITKMAEESFKEFLTLLDTLTAQGFGEHIRIDFSAVTHTNYYSGVVFKGYIKGIPDSVLAGGQYDLMMRKMGRADGAVGFAVYLDGISSLDNQEDGYDTDILLLRANAAGGDVLKAVEQLSKEGERVFVSDDVRSDLRYKKCYIMKEGKAIAYGND